MAFFKGAAREAQRAAQLMQQRDRDRQEIEIQKKKLEAEMRIGNITNKFTTHYDAIEQRLRSDTVGLVTLHEMRAKQEAVVSAREKQMVQAQSQAALQAESSRLNKEKTRRDQIQALSFDVDENDDDEGENHINNVDANESIKEATASNCEEVIVKNIVESTEDEADCIEVIPPVEATTVITSISTQSALKRKRFGKNPNVDTNHLPDVEREEEENRLREKLRVEWINKQIEIKEEEITITYSYWDGCGHRYMLTLRKGSTIAQFLHRCLEQCRSKFNELRSVTHDQLMYIKEDLIIPHHYSFYDFIVTKARGKSGPLFCFDAHEDVRVRSDASVAKDESHAGKVCLRSWYERNKHIFPVSRWEPYDPAKNWDEYTISDKLAIKITVK